MDTETILLYAVCVLIGAIIHAISGFGFGVFAMSVFPFFMPSYTMGLVLSGMMGITITTYYSLSQFRKVNWKYIIVPFVSSVIVGFLTMRYLKGFSDNFLGRVLGLFLILLSVYFLVFEKLITVRMNIRNGIIAGSAAGFIDTMFSMGGTPLALYLSSTAASKEAYLANLSCTILLMSLGTLVNRVIAGMITVEILKYYVFGLIFVVIGMTIGGKIFKTFSPSVLRKAVYIFIAITGVLLVVRSFAK